MDKETIIISLGGSLVAPGEIDPVRNSPPKGPSGRASAGEISNGVDIEFLKKFKNSLQKYIGSGPSAGPGFKFFILVGGGKIARNYQKALLEFGSNSTDRDWMGINITILNAEVVRNVFSRSSYSKIVTNPNKKIKTAKNIIVGAGWKPGWSTDYDAVLMAKNHGVKTIINLTNVDYIYDKNPNDFPDAKPLKQIGWKSFKNIVGGKWSPGLSMPFDPRASKLAKRLKLKVVMINGKNLDRLENFLNNKPFIGTVIQ